MGLLENESTLAAVGVDLEAVRRQAAAALGASAPVLEMRVGAPPFTPSAFLAIKAAIESAPDGRATTDNLLQAILDDPATAGAQALHSMLTDEAPPGG